MDIEARNRMFLFEVVVEKVKSMVESKILVIKSDFANIFSLELKDPKQMHIVMPEPLPIPPPPPGKKGKKKKKKPKPKKKKKGKKGKKVKEVPPPPEPLIQSGQSILFSSNAQILLQIMKKTPLELSLWNKEEDLVFIGMTSIPWDPIFLTFLEQIVNCQDPPPVTLREEYNVFEEGKAKMMAQISIQIKLSHLNDKVTTAFRTLSEDITARKFLYTGINSKTTSYMCTMKTTDEVFEENCNKIENKFIVDKPKTPKKVAYADYKNAPGANLTVFDEDDYCCMGHADKPPESKYKSFETCPDIDFIVDYVRKIIVSCNDNMRMLTPRPTISPRVKATDIDRYCYCRETAWPPGTFAERFMHEAKSTPCPICIDSGKKPDKTAATTFDIANIRGPCGKPECKIARDIRAYIENLVDEDNEEFKLEDLIGPCGSKDCTLAAKIQEFLRHEGVFSHGATREGLSTQCACVEIMNQALTKRDSCTSLCSIKCKEVTSEEDVCGGRDCPHKKPEKKVYDVYYFTVEYNFENKSDKSSVDNTSGDNTPSDKTSGAKTPSEKASSGKTPIIKSPAASAKSSTFKFCGPECPGVQEMEENMTCSKSICSTGKSNETDRKTPCVAPTCPMNIGTPSPADSKVELTFDEIYNPCCVRSCDVAERVKDFIAEGVKRKEKCKLKDEEDPCYCDCVCTFKFSSKTTYCAVCGGYECLGDDMLDQPEYLRPHPCPIYHKLYDKKYIKVQSPWPEEQKKEVGSGKSSKAGSKYGDRKMSPKPGKSMVDKKEAEETVKKTKKQKKKDGGYEKGKKKKQAQKEPTKPSDAGDLPEQAEVKVKKEKYQHYPPVPKHMGWNWAAEDVPGMKPRPNWRPGAANAILARRYKAQKDGQENINKKKRALLQQRKKKIEMKPTLIVTKHDGEYTVQMEVFKKFSKDRLLFQYPYDEKPPLIYTIGKTAEEKRKVQKQRDRKERRETRRKNRLLQSTFRDRCQEICLKAYNQAIGLEPLPNPNVPECPCHASPDFTPSIVDSCSCSDIGTISSSDTDHDEWVIEFTPPAARWDAKAKHPPTLAENECQYNYLDYKVKLLDSSGNPIPRFFKGPDGKQECSDLGGFWGANKVWLEINKDGYIGPDERWVPMNFIGPDGLLYSPEDGAFTDSKGKVWKIGIDGYIDKDGKWACYKNKSVRSIKSRSTTTASTVGAKKVIKCKGESPNKKADDVKDKRVAVKPLPQKPPSKSPSTQQKKTTISTTPALSTKTSKNFEKGNLKKTVHHNPNKSKNPVVMNVSLKYNRSKQPPVPQYERNKQMDLKKLAKYREIIEELSAYDDIGQVKPPVKANRASNTPRRASNTPRKRLSPFTMPGSINYEKNSLSITLDRSGFRTSATSTRFGSFLTNQM